MIGNSTGLLGRDVHSHDDARVSVLPRLRRAFEPRVLNHREPKRLVVHQRACGFVFYLDPKIAVGTIITSPTIAHRAREARHRAGLWQVGVPRRLRRSRRGGDAGGVREAREEAGVDVRLDHLIEDLFVRRAHADDHRLRGDDDLRRAGGR